MTTHIPSTSGAPLEGGFYAGRIRIGSITYALIVAPKAEGEHSDIAWARSQKMVAGAASFNDGLTNTRAMAATGSALAKWMLDLRIGGFGDWYLPALDELEICYRHLKPGAAGNSPFSRSGVNASAIPPTHPYSVTPVVQTDNELFRAGGREAFDEVGYWSSTQHASVSYDAWFQYFFYGSQHYWDKNVKLRARAVRRLAI